MIGLALFLHMCAGRASGGFLLEKGKTAKKRVAVGDSQLASVSLHTYSHQKANNNTCTFNLGLFLF